VVACGGGGGGGGGGGARRAQVAAGGEGAAPSVVQPTRRCTKKYSVCMCVKVVKVAKKLHSRL